MAGSYFYICFLYWQLFRQTATFILSLPSSIPLITVLLLAGTTFIAKTTPPLFSSIFRSCIKKINHSVTCCYR
ncbi:MAG: hypothetical protein ACYTE8_12940, partial [Planctomycetota bacterium]